MNRSISAEDCPLSRPKSQHIVPKSLLRNFTDDKGFLHCFDKNRDNIYKAKPQNVFVQRDLYTIETRSGIKEYQVETGLSQLEGDFERVMAKVIDAARARRRPDVSDSELDVIRYFLAIQSRRTRTTWTMLSEDREEVFEELLEEGIAKAKQGGYSIDESELESVRDRSEIIYKNAWRQMILGHPLEEVYEALALKGLAVGVMQDSENRALTIGDNPVLRAATKNAHLADPSAELIMPVASDVLISLASPVNRRSTLTIDERVREFNQRIVWQSDTIASRSDTLTQSLRRRFRRLERQKKLTSAPT